LILVMDGVSFGESKIRKLKSSLILTRKLLSGTTIIKINRIRFRRSFFVPVPPWSDHGVR
jgi:hypothetical protein